jgi:glycosyltransferase involved in cell wall biosynthesis
MKSATPKISVVIPVWNEAKYLAPCIAGIKSQTFTDFEVITVDKHSTDDTPKLVKAAGWTIFNQTKPGISAARAEGFAKAKAEIIASTNGDTQVEPDWLEKIYSSFLDPEVVCVYGPVIFLEKHQVFYRLMNQLAFILFGLGHLIKNDHPIGENFAVRRSAYIQVGGFNLQLPTAEDVDLCYRVGKTGKTVYLPRLVAHTSNRRLAKEKLHFFLHHIENFIRLRFFGNASSDFKPIR